MDEARRAFELRAFLGWRSAAGRVVCPRGAKSGAATGALALSAKLYLVPFEPIQREIVASAPEEFRILLYRRMMLRIAERIARSGRSLGLITGDSLGQVASQTLRNMGRRRRRHSHAALYRSLAGDDKLEIMAAAEKIGTTPSPPNRSTTAAPFSCPQPAAAFFSEELERAESTMDVEALIRQGIDTVATERYRYSAGRVEKVESFKSATA